jgi:hypothetical protein
MSEKTTSIESFLKDIAYLNQRSSQLSLNVIEAITKENQMLQQQYQLALKKIQELENKSKPKK